MNRTPKPSPATPPASSPNEDTIPVLERTVRRFLHRRSMLAAGLGAAIGIDLVILWELRRLFATPSGAQSMAQGSSWPNAFLLVTLFAGLGALAGWSLQRLRTTPAQRTLDAVSQLEQLVPASRNLLFTAWEVHTAQGTPRAFTHVATPRSGYASAEADTAAIIRRRAERLAATIDVPSLLPWTAARRALLIASGLWIVTLLLVSRLPAGSITQSLDRMAARITGSTAIHRVTVDVTPPAYSARPPGVLYDPERIEALEGSALTFTIAATAGHLIVSTDSGDVVLSAASPGIYRWRTTARRDGFVALSARAGTALPETALPPPDTGLATGAPKLVAITVQRDAAPAVRITSPARDLIVDSTRTTLPVTIEGGDDIGLRTLTLRYTHVSGAGERFTFAEGQASIDLSRRSATAWRASAILPLDSLLREPGDLLVYRALATDGRPGAIPAESDAFIVERTAAGGIAAAGFAIDPDEDRYAVSQQMVILKTERLMAARSTLGEVAAAEQARQLAAEQRRVRAEFVFMTGGEFEQALVADEHGLADLDETHEAESEGDLAAGRMVNRGRTALLTAIRAMSRAVLALGENDLTAALRHEKTALDNLQEAFARQRFLMRALSQREQLDPTRRLTGSLDSVVRASRLEPVLAPETERLEIRRMLHDLVSVQRHNSPGAPVRRQDAPYATLAVRVLQRFPQDPRAQRIATWLRVAHGDGTAPPRTANARAALDSATLALSAWLASSAHIDAAAGSPRE